METIEQREPIDKIFVFLKYVPFVHTNNFDAESFYEDARYALNPLLLCERVKALDSREVPEILLYINKIRHIAETHSRDDKNCIEIVSLCDIAMKRIRTYFPGAKTGLNPASMPNPGNNTGGDVNAPKTAPESDLPEWVPEQLKEKKDFKEGFEKAINWNLITRDGLLLGTLQELADWLAHFIGQNNGKYSWIEADSIFRRTNKHGVLVPVTKDDLTRAFYNFNSKSKQE